MKLSWLAVAGLLAMAATASAAAQTPAPAPRDYGVRQVATLRELNGPHAISKLEAVQIGGITQWVSIRGADRRNPVLLILHGGPGFPAMPTMWQSMRGWEDYFTIVHWDQRGSGKTYASNDPATIVPTMTIERMRSDAVEVIDLVRDRLGKEKIFLAGHSWGSIIGLDIARQRPTVLHAYIGIGQVVDFRESERRGWQFAMDQARARGDAQAVMDLNSVAPYARDGQRLLIGDLLTQRRWLTKYGGDVYGREGYDVESAAARLSSDYDAADLAAFSVSSEYALRHLLAEMAEVDFTDVRTLDCPVILFVGRHDHAVDANLSAQWFERLKAPSKSIVWFEASSHMMMNEEPGRALVELVRLARPDVVERSSRQP